MLTPALPYLLYIHYEVMKCDIYEDRGSKSRLCRIYNGFDIIFRQNLLHIYTYVNPKFRPVNSPLICSACSLSDRGGWTRSIIVESAISIAIDFESCCCFGCECSYSLPSWDWEDQVKCSQKSACTLVHLSNIL